MNCRPIAPLLSDKVIARFWARVEKTDTCWMWKASIRNGYGIFNLYKGVYLMAHRLSVAIARGECPVELTVDHLCKVRHCVNPDHLEMVTLIENTMRGNCPMAQNARKTHCEHGHLLEGDNLYVKQRTGARCCRECERGRDKRRQRDPKRMESMREIKARYRRSIGIPEGRKRGPYAV